MKRVGFMFAGQGAQQVGMGRDLYENVPAAKTLYDRADTILGHPLSRVCFDGPAEALTESHTCQPAIFVTSLAFLAGLRDRLDIEPAVCAGLSLGEFAALHAAGTFSFEDGLKLVAKRGQLMQEACRATTGSMAAVLNADHDLLTTTCNQHNVDVANYNCPGQTVISGATEQVAAAVQALKDAGVSRVIPLDVDGAFHSRLMQPAADRFRAHLADTPMTAPTCPVAQNVAGALISEPDEIRDNLARQITGSVRWEQCVQEMMNTGIDALVEFGPGKVLSGFMRRIDRHFPTCTINSADDLQTAAEALR